MSASVCQTAPAKINLTLKVLGRRADGYHALESLVVFACDVADRVTLTPSSTQRVAFSGPYSEGLGASPSTVSTAQDILAKAARSQQNEQRLQLGDVVVHKEIPLASGLGGGSADAAAFLRAVKACNPIWKDKLDWSALAREVGADVPVCIRSQAQFMSGIGDQLKPAPQIPELAVVLIKTEVAPYKDKTKRVFAGLKADPLNTIAQRQLDEIKEPRFSCVDEVATFVNEVGNDLLLPARALMPDLNAPLERIAAQPACLASSISGAGPTVFGLFANRAQAEAGAQAIQTAEPSWWVKVSSLV